MKKMLIYSIMLISAIHLYSDTDELSWLSRRFHLDDPVIESIEITINGEEIFIAYNKVKDSNSDFIGLFDRAVFYSKTGHYKEYLFINDRNLIIPNGNSL